MPRCSWGLCNSDSRYPVRCIGVYFFPFPRRYGRLPNLERAKQWVELCGRQDFTVDNVTRSHYICSKHFIDGMPTARNPNPLPAQSSSDLKKPLLRRKWHKKKIEHEIQIQKFGSKTSKKKLATAKKKGGKFLIEIDVDVDARLQYQQSVTPSHKLPTKHSFTMLNKMDNAQRSTLDSCVKKNMDLDVANKKQDFIFDLNNVKSEITEIDETDLFMHTYEETAHTLLMMADIKQDLSHDGTDHTLTMMAEMKQDSHLEETVSSLLVMTDMKQDSNLEESDLTLTAIADMKQDLSQEETDCFLPMMADMKQDLIHEETSREKRDLTLLVMADMKQDITIEETNLTMPVMADIKRDLSLGETIFNWTLDDMKQESNLEKSDLTLPAMADTSQDSCLEEKVCTLPMVKESTQDFSLDLITMQIEKKDMTESLVCTQPSSTSGSIPAYDVTPAHQQQNYSLLRKVLMLPLENEYNSPTWDAITRLQQKVTEQNNEAALVNVAHPFNKQAETKQCNSIKSMGRVDFEDLTNWVQSLFTTKQVHSQNKLNEFSTFSHLKTHQTVNNTKIPFLFGVFHKGLIKSSPSLNLKKHHLFHCEICQKGYSTLRSLKQHQWAHTGEKIFKCNICQKALFSSSNLKAHYKLHTGEKPFKCQSCEKAYVSSNLLKKHHRVHTGERPYKCQFCEKAYIDSTRLKSHQRVHTREKILKCDFCEKAFLSPVSLKNHQLTYTKEKTFKCQLCEKSFFCSSHLKTHQLVHTGEKPFKCQFCEKAYFRVSQLKIHQLAHTG